MIQGLQMPGSRVKKDDMTAEERNRMVEVGLYWNGVHLEPEVIEKVIHVVDVVTRNGDSATFKTLKLQK